MTEDAAESTSYDETEPSRPWPEVARLGELIVTELGLRDAVDTLSRWMAHHVAELMERANNGDADAAREASQLILDLWSRRSDWPEGWPPRRSAHAIERLAEAAEPIESHFGPDDGEPEDGEDPWLVRLRAIARLLGDELAIWRRLALVGLNVDLDMAKAEAAESELSEDELGILRGLEISKDSALRHFESAIEGDQSHASRIDLSRKELEELDRSRWALFDAAAAATLGIRSSDAPDEDAGVT